MKKIIISSVLLTTLVFCAQPSWGECNFPREEELREWIATPSALLALTLGVAYAVFNPPHTEPDQ